MSRDRLSNCCCDPPCSVLNQPLFDIDPANVPSGWSVTNIENGDWQNGGEVTIPDSALGDKEAFAYFISFIKGKFTFTVQGVDVVLDPHLGTVSLDGTASIFRPLEGSEEYRAIAIQVTPTWISVFVYDSPQDEAAFSPLYGRGSIQVLDRINTDKSGLTITSNEENASIGSIYGAALLRFFEMGSLVEQCAVFITPPLCTEIHHQEGTFLLEGESYTILTEDQLADPRVCNIIPRYGGVVLKVYDASAFVNFQNVPSDTNLSCGSYEYSSLLYTNQYYVNHPDGGGYPAATFPWEIRGGGGSLYIQIKHGYWETPTEANPYPKPSRQVIANLTNRDHANLMKDLTFLKTAEGELFIDFNAGGRAPGTLSLSVDDNVYEMLGTCDEELYLAFDPYYGIRNFGMVWNVE